VAIQASYVGLSLAKRINSSDGAMRRGLLAGSALSLATGIWGMHFVGMLAIKLPFAIDFAVLPTLLSFLACVLVVGLALLATCRWHLTWLTLAGASLVMGLGIVTMHYIGMLALHAAAHVDHDPSSILLSVLVSVIASASALWLAFGQSRRPPVIVGALALGLAISGMHYVAMAGTTLHPLHGNEMAVTGAVSFDFLAVIVAFVAFVVSGVFILMLLPDGRPPVGVVLAGAAIDQIALNLPVGEWKPASDVEIATVRDTLPIHRDGAVHTLDVADVYSIHANAHYTYVFNGQIKLFCPLSISEVEDVLANANFMRVHRSHIVNLEKIGALRKTVDSVVIDLKCTTRFSVPVSRSKVAELRNRAAILGL
jgi:NO-binding membrane sensor protein with MHYT domain